MRKTGICDLPLHGGKAPRWLFKRMERLAGAISSALVFEYGPDEFLRRVSDPYWFQAFSCVIGFDWHSSGTTTTACGALKQGIDSDELGVYIAGGKGRASRKTPEEIDVVSGDLSLSTRRREDLKHASCLSAKIDNTCVQDSYRLYHHSFIFTEKGKWAVVQQGMNDVRARRYHWLSENVEDFIEEPHNAICCDSTSETPLDLTSREIRDARKTSIDLVCDNPEHLRKYLREGAQTSLFMPAHHPVLSVDVGRGGFDVLMRAYEIQPENYEELISLEGMGPKKIRALALVSDLIYGERPSWKDPVKYSFAHGGKDGYPYPVDRTAYDNSIECLKSALSSAKIGSKDKLYAVKRLRDFLG